MLVQGHAEKDGKANQVIPAIRNPITGIAGRCARAASGHAAAPPLSSVMKSAVKNF